MARESGGRLAEVFELWRRRQRVSVAHIARHGAVARNTLNLIQRGLTRQPEPETLARIATGLATDPYDPSLVDDQIRETIVGDLLAAAEYPERRAEAPEPLLELGIYNAVGSAAKARAWAELIRRNRALGPDAIAALGDEADEHRETGLSTE